MELKTPDEIEGYIEALDLVFAIRANRYKVYGDSWKDNSDEEIFYLIKQKFMRLSHFMTNKVDEKMYESKIDTLIDIVNYSLFMLQNNIDKEVKHEEERA